jgi:hypothetical protein
MRTLKLLKGQPRLIRERNESNGSVKGVQDRIVLKVGVIASMGQSKPEVKINKNRRVEKNPIY